MSENQPEALNETQLDIAVGNILGYDTAGTGAAFSCPQFSRSPLLMPNLVEWLASRGHLHIAQVHNSWQVSIGGDATSPVAEATGSCLMEALSRLVVEENRRG